MSCRPLLQMLPGDSTRPAKPIIMHDCGAQTELHPVESNIDRSYEWNEWQLRRKAIKLVSRSAMGTEKCSQTVCNLKE